MAPISKGKEVPAGFLSKSTPILPAVASQADQDAVTAIAFPPPPKGPGVATGPRSPATHSAASEQAFLENNHQEDGASLTLEESSSSEEEEEEQEQDEDEEMNQAPSSRLLHPSRSPSHLARHNAPMFYPPFYNRPPTPLPPSPSLTSLLRPTFSAASRHTTPDSSDIDAPRTHSIGKASSGNTKLAASALEAPTVPRAAPKVPTYEYYGFALYLGSSAAFLMYILWAYVPAPVLHQMGIQYYPNRWWALAVPCWLVMLIVYIYVALASYNTRYLTLPMASVENLVDEYAQVAVVERETGEIVGAGVGTGQKQGGMERDQDGDQNLARYQFSAADHVAWKGLWSTGTDAVMDVPIGGVCEVLYGD